MQLITESKQRTGRIQGFSRAVAYLNIQPVTAGSYGSHDHQVALSARLFRVAAWACKRLAIQTRKLSTSGDSVLGSEVIAAVGCNIN